MSEPVETLTHASLSGAAHGFLGRKGGVSEGTVAGLNVSYAEDDPAHTAENRRRVVAAVLPGADQMTFWGPGLSQGHSDAVRRVDGVAGAEARGLDFPERPDLV